MAKRFFGEQVSELMRDGLARMRAAFDNLKLAKTDGYSGDVNADLESQKTLKEMAQKRRSALAIEKALKQNDGE